MGPPDGLANRDQVWFSRSMSACSLFFLGPVTHRLENCLSSGGTLRPRATRYSRSTSDRHRIAAVSRRIVRPFGVRIERRASSLVESTRQVFNPEYLLKNGPQLKKSHAGSPKFGLYLVLNCRPFKPLLNY